MNSLFVIAPYDYEGLWVFDDERVGLEQEPFVSGADTMIDALVAGIPRLHAKAGMGAAGVKRQCLPLRRTRQGRLAVPCPVQVF